MNTKSESEFSLNGFEINLNSTNRKKIQSEELKGTKTSTASSNDKKISDDHLFEFKLGSKVDTHHLLSRTDVECFISH